MNKARVASYTLATLVHLAALAVIAGWIFHIDILKRVIPGAVTMKFSTALSFYFASIISFCTMEYRRRYTVLSQVFLLWSTMATLLIMSILLAGVLLNARTGMEDFLVNDSTEAVYTTAPGRPSIGTMISFICFGVAGLMILLKTISVTRIRIPIYMVGSIGLLALLGYLLNEPYLYWSIDGISTAMAIHTAGMFTLLSLAFHFALASKPNT